MQEMGMPVKLGLSRLCVQSFKHLFFRRYLEITLAMTAFLRRNGAVRKIK